MADSIQLSINGVPYTVSGEEAAATRLVTFIRDRALLTGTRHTCLQGGCGACTVVATVPDLDTGGTSTFSVHSCLASVYNCDGWSVTTVEALGNREDGYHVIQERLADHYGSQCGYCSSGMVMNMFGLTQSKETWTDEDVEKNLDGNICRCTGYRPILDAFKSIAPADIEDVAKSVCPMKSPDGSCKKELGTSSGGGRVCWKGLGPEGEVVDVSGGQGCSRARRGTALKVVTVDGVTYYYPTTIQELVTTVDGLEEGLRYQLMFGNTTIGITGILPRDAVISTRNVAALTTVSVTTAEVTAGAAVSITTLRAAFKTAQVQDGFEYLAKVDAHWQKVASTSLRNLGSWAGNLWLRLTWKGFISDIMLTLIACGAEVLIASRDGSTAWVKVSTLFDRNVEADREVFLRLRFLPLSQDTVYHSYKVMPRSANALAYVNGAHSIRVDANAAYTVLETPVITFGGINGTFIRATATEEYLTGKSLADVSVLQEALTVLAGELEPDSDPVHPDPAYRVQAAQALLYKTIMRIISDGATVDPGILSGAGELVRPLSSGVQTYDDNAATWPLGQPIPKLESKAQCAGEAKYINDDLVRPDELHGVFVQSTKANAALVSVDPSEALAVAGVVGFVSAADIPGVNDMQPFSDATVQPVFAEGRVGYHGQAVGLLLGTDLDTVKAATALVKVTYADENTPILTIADAIANGLPPDQPDPFVVGDVAAGFAASTRIIEGAMSRNGQYHFHMESQTVRVVPNEESFDVAATTQWATGTQAAIAQVLAIDTNRINVTVKRLGGAFGVRIIAGNLVHAAAALAAFKYRKPVRVALDLPANMTMIGWRDPFYFTYKVGVDDAGKLQAVQASLIGDAGFVPVDSAAPAAAFCLPNCYSCPNWEVTPVVAVTDTACNTWCRTPSTIEGITFMEYAMEHVASELQMDPLEFRKLNLLPDGGVRMASKFPIRTRNTLRLRGVPLKEVMGAKPVIITRNLIGDMITQIEVEADVASRKAEIHLFNNENRWRKRGLAVMPMLWPYEVSSVYGMGVFIAIYGNDGTVAITHGGVEMGQGINTKVAQIAAYFLGCPLELVRIKDTNTLSGANSDVTGGSVGTDVNSYCAQQAATRLKTRLDGVALPGDTWQQTVRRAMEQGVSLSEYYWNGPDEVKGYAVFGVACTEVELDVLTGKFQVLRTDILEDAGTSTNPLVDIGQVEGSWLFGQGLFTTEFPVYDPQTGAKLTFDIWNYKPLLALDIPTDLRVTLLKDAPNPEGVLSSKVTSEPPVCLAFAVALALRVAIRSARADAGDTSWFQMDTPLSIDRIQQLCLVDSSQFTYTWTR